MPPVRQTPITTALAALEAAIRQEQCVKHGYWLADCAKASGVNYAGTEVAPFVPMDEDQVRVEAERRLALRNSPDAVLKRALAALADTGSEQAYYAWTAAQRGDAGWQSRALAVLQSWSAQGRKVA